MVIKAALLEAQAETAAKETSLSQATKTLAVAKAKLKSIIGVTSQPQAVDFSAYATLMTTLMGLGDQATDSMIAKLNVSALSNNPSIAVSTIAVAQAESEIAAARAAYLPTVSAAWSHEASYTAAGGIDLASGGSFSVAVSIPLDVLVTKNAVEAKTAEAQKTALSKEIDADNLAWKPKAPPMNLFRPRAPSRPPKRRLSMPKAAIPSNWSCIDYPRLLHPSFRMRKRSCPAIAPLS